MLLLSLPQYFTQCWPFNFEVLKLMLVHCLLGFTLSAFLYVCLSTLASLCPSIHPSSLYSDYTTTRSCVDGATVAVIFVIRSAT